MNTNAKDNAVQQAQFWSLEAKTQASIVRAIYAHCGLQGDWNGAVPVTQYIDALKEEIGQLRQILTNADAVSRLRFEKYGLCDAIDNGGAPYPTQYSADIIAKCADTHPPSDRLQEMLTA